MFTESKALAKDRQPMPTSATPEEQYQQGLLLLNEGKPAEAEPYFRAAVRERPDWAEAHSHLALCRLMRGDYARGWPEYEWRWKNPARPSRNFSQPRWDGRFLDHQPILLYAEQGFGEILQFV